MTPSRVTKVVVMILRISDPHQLPLPLHDVLVVPLDLPGLGEPAAEGGALHVRHVGVDGLGGLEAPLPRQSVLFERLTAPEQQADAVLERGISDDGVAIEEPDRPAVVDLALGLRQRLADLTLQEIAN